MVLTIIRVVDTAPLRSSKDSSPVLSLHTMFTEYADVVAAKVSLSGTRRCDQLGQICRRRGKRSGGVVWTFFGEERGHARHYLSRWSATVQSDSTPTEMSELFNRDTTFLSLPLARCRSGCFFLERRKTEKVGSYNWNIPLSSSQNCWRQFSRSVFSNKTE